MSRLGYLSLCRKTNIVINEMQKKKILEFDNLQNEEKFSNLSNYITP